MIAIAAVVVAWYPPIASLFLIIGLSILLRGAYLDRKYGKYRPSEREINYMGKEEYKKRLREEPKFRDYVNHVCKKQYEKPFGPNDF